MTCKEAGHCGIVAPEPIETAPDRPRENRIQAMVAEMQAIDDWWQSELNKAQRKDIEDSRGEMFRRFDEWRMRGLDKMEWPGHGSPLKRRAT